MSPLLHRDSTHMLVSIVHDFAVLYSPRVHQKDKKWSDGRLKYYEFNKKIEVVSDSNILVCSDFYPHNARPPLENGVFEDGNTYILPSGKLIVEFSEYLGCTERDISNIFLKSKSSEVVSERSVKREEARKRIDGVRSEGEGKERRENVINLEDLRLNKTTENVVKVENQELRYLKTKSVLKLEENDSPLKLADRGAREIGRGPGRVGLERPKRNRQMEVTRFVKKLTVEERLATLDRKTHKRVRIPVGSNRMTVRLHRELANGDPGNVEVKIGNDLELDSDIDDEILEMAHHLKG